MIKYIIIFILISFSIKAIASMSVTGGFDYTLPSPPKTSDMQSLYPYLYNIYNQWMTAQVTTTNPNGAVDGGYGLIAIYFDGTNYWLMMQTSAPSGSSWVGTQLGAVP